MSLAVQVAIDGAALSDPAKLNHNGASSHSGEFSGAIDKANSELGNSQTQRVQEAGETREANSKRDSDGGNSPHSDGKKLPSNNADETEKSIAHDKNSSSKGDFGDNSKNIADENADQESSLNANNTDDVIDQLFNAELALTQLGESENGFFSNVLNLDDGLGGSGRLNASYLTNGDAFQSIKPETVGELPLDGILDESADQILTGLQSLTVGGTNGSATLTSDQTVSKEVEAFLRSNGVLAANNPATAGAGKNIGVGNDPNASMDFSNSSIGSGLSDEANLADFGADHMDLKALAVEGALKAGKELGPNTAQNNSLSLNNGTLLNNPGAQPIGSNPLGLSMASGQHSLSMGTETVGAQNSLTLATPITANAWGEDFAVRMRSLANGNVQQATLNLRPAELGSIDVMLSNEGDETKVQFVVQNAAVKEAVEASLPKLREIFEEAGLSLSDTDVQDQSQFSQASDGETDRSAGDIAGSGQPADNEDASELDANERTVESNVLGTVDYFI